MRDRAASRSFLGFLALCAFLARPSEAAFPVLCYHVVQDHPKAPYSVSTEAFTQQMKYLSDNGYRAMTVGGLVGAIQARILPDKAVVV